MSEQEKRYNINMNFALTYLVGRLIYRIGDFLKHWYVHSAKMYANYVIDQLSALDRSLAWGITFRHFFEPLYKDYSFLGRVLGVFFRTLRFAFGTVVYALIFIVAVLIYLIWALTIPFLILKIFFP